VRIGDLAPPEGARHKVKRRGRGIGSGHGKTSTRGHKGQKARTNVPPGFEGGQTPLQRRMRKKRGISKTAMPVGPFRTHYAEVNVGQLEPFEAGSVVDAQTLLERRVIRKLRDGVRVLGNGELSKALTVRASHFSASAAAKIEAAGGRAEVTAEVPRRRAAGKKPAE
jgi:large subunit ribosomal protein L15